MRRLLPLAAAVVALAGCGDDDEEAAGSVKTVTEVRTVTNDGMRTQTRVVTVTTQSARPPRKTPTGVVTVKVPKNTAMPEARPTGKPTFRVTLTADSHEANAGEAFPYVVRATRNNRAVGGTAKMRVFVDGELVDTIGFFAFEGTLRRTHRWPPVLKGKRAVLQAEVEGPGGTHRANWPVDVR